MGLKSKVSRAMHKAFDTPPGYTTVPPKKWAEYGINQPAQPMTHPSYRTYEQHEPGYEVPLSAADSVSQRGDADNEHHNSADDRILEEDWAHENASAPSLRAVRPSKRNSPPPAYRSRQGSKQSPDVPGGSYAHSEARLASESGYRSTVAMSETTSCRPLTFRASSVACSSSKAPSEYEAHVPLVARKASVSTHAESSRAASSVYSRGTAQSTQSTGTRRSKTVSSKAQSHRSVQTPGTAASDSPACTHEALSVASGRMSSRSVHAKSTRTRHGESRSEASNVTSRASRTVASNRLSGSTAVPKCMSTASTRPEPQLQSTTPNVSFGLTTNPDGGIQFMFNIGGSVASQFDTPSQPPRGPSPAMSTVGDRVTECGDEEDEDAPLLSQHEKIMSWSRNVPSGRSVISDAPSRASSMLRAPFVRPPPSMSRTMVAPQVDLPILSQAQRVALSRAPSHVSRASRADGVKTMLYHMSM